MKTPSKLLMTAACAFVFGASPAQAGDPIHIFVNLGLVSIPRMIHPTEATLRVGQTYQYVVSNPSEEVHVVSAPELAASADTLEVRADSLHGARVKSSSRVTAISTGISVAPGEMLHWTFTPRVAGTFKFGCDQQEHKAAGMTHTVRVIAGNT